jgi:hypothetical protein
VEGRGRRHDALERAEGLLHARVHAACQLLDLRGLQLLEALAAGAAPAGNGVVLL